MAFTGDVARLKKLTREILFKEALRERQGETQSVVQALDCWRAFRGVSRQDLVHFATAISDDCKCEVCEHINKRHKIIVPERAETATGEVWVGEMLELVETWARGISPPELRLHLAMDLAMEGREPEELLHCAVSGFFLTHTPEQSAAESRFQELYERTRVN